MIDPSKLMFIEPQSLVKEEEINDNYTEIALLAWAIRKEPLGKGSRWRGTHKCACGESSDNIRWFIGKWETNSLLIHYVKYHRSEIPPSELQKLKDIGNGIL